MDFLSQALNAAQFFDWDFLLDKPLRILVIVVIALLVNFALRFLINRFASHIARGDDPSTTSEPPSKISRAAGRTQEWLTQDSPTLQLRRSQRARTVGSVLGSITSIIITAITILMVLQELGFNLAPVLASAGIAGVAIGFGAQALVKDYLSGLFIVIEDQYGIGDTVDLGEAIGTVEEVGLRTTRVRGVDGTLWHVRNGEILRVGNQSQGWARAVMDIPVPPDVDEDVINDIIRKTADTLRTDPVHGANIMEEPEIWGIEQLTGDAMTIRMVIKTVPQQQWAVARAFRTELKRTMNAAGIRMPMAQQTLIRTVTPGVPPQRDPLAPEDDDKNHKDGA